MSPAYAIARTDDAPSEASIYADQNLIEGALMIEPDWLSDAVGYALSSGDWEYAKRQITKHAGPILAKAEQELRA